MISSAIGATGETEASRAAALKEVEAAARPEATAPAPPQPEAPQPEKEGPPQLKVGPARPAGAQPWLGDSKREAGRHRPPLETQPPSCGAPGRRARAAVEDRAGAPADPAGARQSAGRAGEAEGALATGGHPAQIPFVAGQRRGPRRRSRLLAEVRRPHPRGVQGAPRSVCRRGWARSRPRVSRRRGSALLFAAEPDAGAQALVSRPGLENARIDPARSSRRSGDRGEPRARGGPRGRRGSRTRRRLDIARLRSKLAARVGVPRRSRDPGRASQGDQTLEGTADPMLQNMLKEIRKPSANVHWSRSRNKLLIIDLQCGRAQDLVGGPRRLGRPAMTGRSAPRPR